MYSSPGMPSGTVVATSSAYDVARLPTTAQVVRFSIKSSQTLSASTPYHLVAQGSWTVSATNYVAWRMDGSAGTYADGAKALFDSDTSTWTTVTDDDMIFEVGIEIDNGVLVLPTGYTKRCFLGWVYNDASGNFIPFLQVERTRRDVSLSETNNLAVPLLGSVQFWDLWFLLPPRKILKVLMALTGTGTSGAVAAIGDLRATDISTSGDTTGAQAVLGATMDVVDAAWRGIGHIARSGFALKPAFHAADARRRFRVDAGALRKRAGAMPPGCDCARVVLGRIAPNQCVLYGRACTPRQPVGPCMVSDEGACRIWWASGQRAAAAVAA